MSNSSKLAMAALVALVSAGIFMANRDAAAPRAAAKSAAIPSMPAPVLPNGTPRIELPASPGTLDTDYAFDDAIDRLPSSIEHGSEPAPVEAAESSGATQLAALGLDPAAVAHFQLRVDPILQERAGLAFQVSQENAEHSYRQARLDELNYQLSRIRATVGDDVYDRHLYAAGKPNRLIIGADSPAAVFAAGLALGDVVIAYNGRRVFDAFEAQALDQGGDPEEMIRLDLMRADTLIEIMIPCGLLQDLQTATASVNPTL